MNVSAVEYLIEHGGLQLYGQPKWTFNKNTCNTYEVFVEKAMLDDNTLVPIWMISDLIEKDEHLCLRFSRWFLKNALIETARLTKECNVHITVSMNLLPAYANHSKFVDEVKQFSEEAGLPLNHHIQFEVCEPHLLNDAGVRNLNSLHDEYEVGLWLTNFGTGHSNVDMLREVHYDGIELDRSFARHIPQDDQCCRTIFAVAQLAQTLDLKVCAKGIETQEQFEFYEEVGAFKGQGYLIGMPMELTKLKEYIMDYAIKKS